MQESSIIAEISELSELAERAKRASETTKSLAQEYRFIVTWYGTRARSRIRPHPMLDADMIEAKAYRPYLKNEQSGGHVTDIEIAAFLSGPRNPEQDALLRRIRAVITNTRPLSRARSRGPAGCGRTRSAAWQCVPGRNRGAPATVPSRGANSF